MFMDSERREGCVRCVTPQALACLVVAVVLLAPGLSVARDAGATDLPSYFWRLFGLSVVLALGLGALAWLFHKERKSLKAMAEQLQAEVAGRREAQKRLELFRLAVEQSPASIVITSPKGVIEYVNQEFCRTTGYTVEEAVGQNPRLLKAGGLSDEHYAQMWQQISNGVTWRGEFVNRRKSGEVYWESASICPVLEQDGEVSHFIAVKKDITSRKRMEEELSRRTDVLQATLDNMLHGIVMVDRDGMVLAHNRRLQELFGFPPDYFDTPRTFGDVIQFWCERLGLDTDAAERFIRHARNNSAHSFELALPDGRTVEVLHNPLPDGGFVRTATDITPRKQAEALREDMERMARHDLKTPLNGIIGLPQLLLLDDNLTAEQREVLEQIRQVGYRMLRSINLSLDLFKMETGHYQLAPQEVDMLSLLREVLRDAGLPRERDRVQAVLLCEGREPDREQTLFVRGEELLCYNLFANLVTNAAQAAPPDSCVRIEAARDGDFVQVSVHNQGVVPEKVRDRFFEKYATHGKSSGTGLGTYSARLFARVQQGDVTMRSSAERGTTLTVRLPAAPQAG